MVLQKGGKIVRLAGLYTASRGAHTYWMKMATDGKQIETNSDGIVNLIHYADAADFTLRMLEKGILLIDMFCFCICTHDVIFFN